MHTSTLYLDVVTPRPSGPGTTGARLALWLRRSVLVAAVLSVTVVALATGTPMALTLLGLAPFALVGAWFARRRLERGRPMTIDADPGPTVP